MRLCVLVSGSGTILEAILASGVEVALVASDRTCRGLDVASAYGVSGELVDRAAFGGFSSSFDRDGYSKELARVLENHDIDLVAMAGFGTIITSSFHDSFPGRILNTHPSLLPAFKGWHAVRSALDASVEVTGCTVHVATLELDDGPILAQRRVPIFADDTEESLHERIKTVERALYPLVLTRVMASLDDGIEPAVMANTLEES